MKFHLCNKLIYILLIALCSLTSGCTDSNKLKATHLEKAKEFIEIENFEKARIELKNVLQIDPKTAEAYYLLGKVEEQRNEWQTAIGNYLKAIELNPEILDAQIRLAQYHLSLAKKNKLQNNTQQKNKHIDIAKEKIDFVLKADPSSKNGKILQATVSHLKGNTSSSISMLETILSNSPETYEAIILLSKIHEQNNNISKAQEILTTGIQHIPDNSLLHYRLAKFYEKHGHLGKAITIMEELTTKNQENFKYTMLLGYYYEVTSQPDKTEKLLRDAIKTNPQELSRHNIFIQFIEKHKGTNSAIQTINESIKKYPELTRLRFTLATLYLKNEDTNNAILQLETIIKNQKYTVEEIEAHKNLASIYLDTKQLEQARAHIDYLLADNPGDNDALLLNAKMAFMQKNYQTSITSLRTVLKFRPDDIEILRLLAESYINNHEPELAEELFRRITYLQPENIRARLDKIRFDLASDKISEALKDIDSLLINHPDSLDIIKLKTDALLSAGNIREAIPLIDKIKKLAPNDAEGWFRMGRIYKILKKDDMAIAEFESAWKKSTSSDALLAELIDMEISNGKHEQARKRLKEILINQPDHPTANKFLAMAYLSDNKPDLAINELEKHLIKRPRDIASYRLLANISLKNDNYNSAVNYYLHGLENSPDSIELIMGLASTYEQFRRLDDAIALYKKAIELDPEHIIAKNNLAMLLITRNKYTEDIIQAQKLVEAFNASNHPMLLDTYAWVNFYAKNYNSGIIALNKALSLDPDNPIFHYHLGMIYQAKGNTDQAIQNLQTATSKGTFPGYDTAVRTLESIKSE